MFSVEAEAYAFTLLVCEFPVIREEGQMKMEVGRTSRPARPARCIADDLVISRVNSVSKPTLGVSSKLFRARAQIHSPPPESLAR